MRRTERNKTRKGRKMKKKMAVQQTERSNSASLTSMIKASNRTGVTRMMACEGPTVVLDGT